MQIWAVLSRCIYADAMLAYWLQVCTCNLQEHPAQVQMQGAPTPVLRAEQPTPLPPPLPDVLQQRGEGSVFATERQLKSAHANHIIQLLIQLLLPLLLPLLQH